MENISNEAVTRVGKEYQAIIPPFISLEGKAKDRALSHEKENALLVWAPPTQWDNIPEEYIDQYVTIAREKHNYHQEQALGMLFWHKYDIRKALKDLEGFYPRHVDDWIEEDKVLFEQALHFQGKDFRQIQKMLPDKTIPSLIQFYYKWRNVAGKTSVKSKKNITHDESYDIVPSTSDDNNNRNGRKRVSIMSGQLRRKIYVPQAKIYPSDELENNLKIQKLVEVFPNEIVGSSSTYFENDVKNKKLEVNTNEGNVSVIIGDGIPSHASAFAKFSSKQVDDLLETTQALDISKGSISDSDDQ